MGSSGAWMRSFLLLISAGAAASAVATDSLHTGVMESQDSDKTTHVAATCDEPEPSRIHVGLVRICVPHTIRDRVTNDVILKMAIREATDTVYIYIHDQDKHARVNYTSELYNVTWDIAATMDKLDLHIQIVPPASPLSTWDEYFFMPELDAVYGSDLSTPEVSKLLPRHGLLPVAYRSPATTLWKYLIPGEKYVEDDESATSTFDVVLVNGTFDHLHHGHKKLLSVATSICSTRLVVGITASMQMLAAKPFAELIEPLDTRKHKICDFVASLNSHIRIDFVDVQCDGSNVASTYEEPGAAVVISTSDVETFSDVILTRKLNDFPMLFVRIVRRTDESTLSSSRLRARLAAPQLKKEK